MGELDQYSNKSGWQVNGKLETYNVSQTQKLAADFSQAPGQYTIQFATGPIIQPGAPAAPIVKQTKAVIKWSVEGTFVRRQISLYDGASISGVGQAVDVEIIDSSFAAAGGTHPNVEYDVSAQVAKGTRPSQQQPPFFYLEAVSFVGAPSVTVPIPQNIGVISTFIQANYFDQVGTSISAVQVGGPSSSQCFLVSTGDSPIWRPIPPGSQNITIFRPVGSIGTLHYGIFLGIDG